MNNPASEVVTTSQVTGLVKELSTVPVLVIMAAVFTASWYIFELRSGLSLTADRVVALQKELDVYANRGTEIAQLRWSIDQLNDSVSQLKTSVDGMQENVRDAQSEIRDLQKDVLPR